MTHQVWRQAKASKLSNTALGWFGLLLSCSLGLRATKVKSEQKGLFFFKRCLVMEQFWYCHWVIPEVLS